MVFLFSSFSAFLGGSFSNNKFFSFFYLGFIARLSRLLIGYRLRPLKMKSVV